MSIVQRVEQRRDSFEALAYDGSEDAAGWVTDRWPDLAVFADGELTLYGSWVIEPGNWIVDQHGSPNVMPDELFRQMFAAASPEPADFPEG